MAQFVEMEIDQGTDFSIDLGLKNDDGTYVNFTGYRFESQMRKSHASLSVAGTFTTNVSGSSNNSLLLTMSAEATSVIKPGRYVFDVKKIEISTQKITRLAEGIVNVNPQVTR